MATNKVNGINGHPQTMTVDAAEFAKHEYDYLILGGGTAGLAIAARLSEDPNVSVGVIEAGRNNLNDMLVDTPAMFPQMFSKPEYDWNYKTIPQIGGSGERQTEHHLVRGKMLGGSSGINYMMYVRGSNSDYDDWATIAGDNDWSSKNLKRYMRKHETLEPIDDSVTDRDAMPFVGEFHGTDGPIRTSFSTFKYDIEDDVIHGADKATGFHKKPMDPWSGDHIGFYQTLATITRTGPHKGKRSYSARAYFEPNSGRPNLIVTSEALVRKVILDGDRATGASFEQRGKQFDVKVKREVIVCGGVVGSPQILELSGIGDPEPLRKVGIECKIENRAVGENLQDHVTTAILYETKEGVDTLDSASKPEVLEQFMKTYQETKSGPLSCTSTVQGFLPIKKFATDQQIDKMVSDIRNTNNKTDFTRKQRETVIAQLQDDNSANLQLVLINATANFEPGFESDQAKLFSPPRKPDDPCGIALVGIIQYPSSRGSVHIRSSDPKEHPDIDPAYLTDQVDLDQMAVCLKFLNATAESEPLKSKLGRRTYPPPDVDLTNMEQCRKAVLNCYLGNYHPVGSVAMGDALDSRLRVKGVKGLRVADASIFPGHISGNPVGTVYTVAEKAADLIKEDNA